MTDELNPNSTDVLAENGKCPISDEDLAKDIVAPLFSYFMEQLCAESHKGRAFTETGLSDLEKLITDYLADPASLERLRNLEAWAKGLDVDANGKIDVLEGFRKEFDALVARVVANESSIAGNKALQDAIAKELADFRITAAETIANLTSDISDLKVKGTELDRAITDVGEQVDKNGESINSIKGTAEGNVVKIDDLRRDLDNLEKYDPEHVRLLLNQGKCEFRMGVYAELKGAIEGLIAGHQPCTAYPEVAVPVNAEEEPPENEVPSRETEEDLPPENEVPSRETEEDLPPES